MRNKFKTIITVIMMAAIVLSLSSGFAEARNRTRQMPIFGQPIFRNNELHVRVMGYSGIVEFDIKRGSDVIHGGYYLVERETLIIELPSGMPNDTYTVTLWTIAGDRAYQKNSFNVRFSTGGSITVSTEFLCSQAGRACGFSLYAVRAPFATVYSSARMDRPIYNLARYDRVIVAGACIPVWNAALEAYGSTRNEEVLDNFIVYVRFMVPETNVEIRPGAPPGFPAVITGEDPRLDERVRITGLVQRSGYVYAHTLRVATHRDHTQMVHDIQEIALSRRGWNGIYNQSLRFSWNYVDCSAFVWWSFLMNGVHIPSLTASTMTRDIIDASRGSPTATVYSKHQAFRWLEPGYKGIPDDAIAGSIQANIHGSWVNAITLNEPTALWFDDSWVIGSKDAIQAGDTVSVGLRGNSGPQTFYVRWRELLLNIHCDDVKDCDIPVGRMVCSRPSHMMRIYDYCYEGGWVPVDVPAPCRRDIIVRRWHPQSTCCEGTPIDNLFHGRLDNQGYMFGWDKEEHILRVDHIGLYIGIGERVRTDEFGDNLFKGTFIHTGSNQFVDVYNLWALYNDPWRIVHIGRPLDVPAWRR